jgi:CheY-like chemotaxis protein
VLKVRDGNEAIAAARERRPAVMVLDVMMPRLTGDDALRELRADPALHDMKVILLSARVQKGDVERGLAAGADAYLTKPFKSSELVAKIEELLA